MRTKLFLGLFLIASFVMVANIHSSDRSYTPTGYCRFDKDTGLCSKQANGVVCYAVMADCTYVE